MQGRGWALFLKPLKEIVDDYPSRCVGNDDAGLVWPDCSDDYPVAISVIALKLESPFIIGIVIPLVFHLGVRNSGGSQIAWGGGGS